MSKSRPLVFIPTYNEAENCEPLCRQILDLKLPLDILFIDDNSTDGTAAILERLAKENDNVSVVHRSGKLGIGSAHLAGIRYGYEHGYAQLITMDCDFTHSPHHIPEFLARSEQGFEVVISSRFTRRESLEGWNLYRKSLTHLGHLLTRVMLGMPYDATGGYRCYRLDVIPQQAFDIVSSKGYSFFFESLYILHRNGYRISEIPVTLPNRMYGHSKMDASEIQRSVELLLKTFTKSILSPKRFEIPKSAAKETAGERKPFCSDSA